MDQNTLCMIEWVVFVGCFFWRHNMAHLVSVFSAIFADHCKKGQWSGTRTARYRKVFNSGSLWWGYNRNSGSVFLIFDGNLASRIRFLQIQSWKPKFHLETW